MNTIESKSTAIEDIKSVLKNTNLAWSTGNPTNLEKYFHEDIIIVSADLKILGSGKANCIKSYIEFLSKAKIVNFTDSDPIVNLFENSAIVFYEYDISWEMDNKLFEETARELYVFERSAGKWLIIMRKLIPNS